MSVARLVVPGVQLIVPDRGTRPNFGMRHHGVRWVTDVRLVLLPALSVVDAVALASRDTVLVDERPRSSRVRPFAAGIWQTVHAEAWGTGDEVESDAIGLLLAVFGRRVERERLIGSAASRLADVAGSSKGTREGRAR
jgi:hypothetical protein